MIAHSLPVLVHEHLAIARSATSGRSATTVLGGRENHLRQTLIALAEGHELADHDSPGEATLQVLAGAVLLEATTDAIRLSTGDLFVISEDRHAIRALEDCAVLLTVANAL